MNEFLDRLGRLKPLRTAAQAALAMIGADALDVLHADWIAIASSAAGAGIVSALMILAQGQTWLAEPRTPDEYVPEPMLIPTTVPPPPRQDVPPSPRQDVPAESLRLPGEH